MSITRRMARLPPFLLSTALATCPTDPQRLRPFAILGCVVLLGFIMFLLDSLNDSPVPRGTAQSPFPPFRSPALLVLLSCPQGL